MRKTNKILLATIATALIFSWFAIPLISAAPDDGEMFSAQYKVGTGEDFGHQFQNRTRIRIRNEIQTQNAYNISGQINCQALKIGNKDFIIEVTDAPGDMEMNMTCTEEEAELGLELGNNVRNRNRNRYRYQEGFALNISSNCTELQARLRIKANNQNRNGEWAFYNGENGEWESIPTNVDSEGYLTASTDHFSVWTILLPETDYTLYIVIGASVAVVAVVGIVVFLYYKKKR